MPTGTVTVALKLPDCVAMVCAVPRPLRVAVVFAVKPLPVTVMVPPGTALVGEAVRLAVPVTVDPVTIRDPLLLIPLGGTTEREIECAVGQGVRQGELHRVAGGVVGAGARIGGRAGQCQRRRADCRSALCGGERERFSNAVATAIRRQQGAWCGGVRLKVNAPVVPVAHRRRTARG